MSMTYSDSFTNFQYLNAYADPRYENNADVAGKMQHIGHLVATSASNDNNNVNNMNEFDYSEERLPTEILPIEIYQHWFRAIVEDDATYANDLLTNCTLPERKRMLNGRFLFELGHQSKLKLLNNQYGMDCVFERPLILAVMFKSGKIFQLLINMNVNVFTTEKDGSNITHALVWAASHQEKDEEEFCQFYDMVMSRLGYNSRKRLLLMENNEGMRPLELAMRMTTFKLAIHILDTEGVYYRTQAQMGAHVCTWFDVTDYERPGASNRRHLSPLKFITILEKENLGRLNASGILQHPLFERWISNKLSISLPYLVIWCSIRLVYTILLYLCTFAAAYYTTHTIHDTTDDGVANNTSTTASITTVYADDSTQSVTYQASRQVSCANSIVFDMGQYYTDILRYVTIAFSGMIILFDIVDVVYHYAYRKRKEAPCYRNHRSMNFVVKTVFYRYCNFLLAVAVAIYLSTTLAGPKYLNITTKAYIAANILNVWSILYFVQFLPAFGYFVIIVQRMLKDMFNFLLLYLLLFFSFSQTFYSLFRMRGYCTQAFISIPWSLYSTFQVMLNMMDLTQYVKLGDLTDVAILHSTYVIIVPILLVNFLIALMSNSVAEVAENRHVIMKLQRLSAAILVEHRLRLFFAPLFRLQKRHIFVVREDKIYVECLIFRTTKNQLFTEHSIENVRPGSFSRPNSL